MTELSTSSAKELRRLIDQIERLQEEMAALAGDVKDKLSEAKSTGFDTKIIKKILAIRRKGRTKHEDEEAIIATYLHAIGFAETPLGTWADTGAKKKLAIV